MDDARRIVLVETKTIDAHVSGTLTIVSRIRFQYGNYLDSPNLECDPTGTAGFKLDPALGKLSAGWKREACSANKQGTSSAEANGTSLSGAESRASTRSRA